MHLDSGHPCSHNLWFIFSRTGTHSHDCCLIRKPVTPFSQNRVHISALLKVECPGETQSACRWIMELFPAGSNWDMIRNPSASGLIFSWVAFCPQVEQRSTFLRDRTFSKMLAKLAALTFVCHEPLRTKSFYPVCYAICMLCQHHY